MSTYFKQLKYRKSASIAHLKTNPQVSIQFNPKQFVIGQSKIQRLSSKVQFRRNSLTLGSKNQKSIKRANDNDLEIELLKSINQKLSKQNKQLKKQISNYQNQVKGFKKIQFYDEVVSQSTKIMNQKINKTKCSSKILNSDNQTGLYSSKQLSYGQFQSVNQMFNAFIKKSVKPALSNFSQQLNNFFQNIQQTYIKLKLIYQSLPIKNKNIQYQKCEFLLKKFNQICQVKVRSSNLSCLKQIQTKKVEVQKGKKEECLQLMTTQEIIEKFQKYILKILRSQKMLKNLKINIVVRKFINKINQI